MFRRLFGRRQKSNTASIAKERLQIIVAHERVRNKDGDPDFMQDLQRDILEVVKKYLPIDSNQLKVAMDRDGECDVLELNIVLSDKEEASIEALSKQVEALSETEAK